jgi:S-methylmethionine-dependent homocysteine/selenocysteine methylase|tara:strand:+ start:170 stop:1066 length:897 start_codon:yes stop_codon:yes gene_type:complete
LRDFHILDCGLGTELKRKGFDLPDWTNSIWSAQALIDEPELILEIHKESIEAGSNVITTSNYYATPLILKEKDSSLDFKKLSETALSLAEDAVKSSDREVMIAGCFPPINVSFRPDLTPKKNEVEDFYEALASIYKDRVDVILCETMASIFEGDIAAKVATKYFDKVWLSWNTRGLDPLLIPSGEDLHEAALKVSKYNLDCQLINCAHADLITKSLEILKSCVQNIGVYANSSVHISKNEQLESYENISEVHYHHKYEITPREYADFAKEWISMGCKVIGGCCTTTPEHIRLIAELRS